MNLFYWAAGAYVASYAVTIIAIRYEWHSNGCKICLRYGDTCPCGYMDYMSFMEMVDNELLWPDKSVRYVAAVGIFLVVVPLLAWVALIMSHGTNPLHRKFCLASVLQGDE